MHAESTEDKLIAAVNKEPKYTPAPQVEMVSELPEPGINTANHAHVRIVGYTADQMRAFREEGIQAALNARAGGGAKDAERYRWLRSRVYAGEFPIGEAYLNLMVVGACPTIDDFDVAIDAAIDAALASQAVGVKDGK